MLRPEGPDGTPPQCRDAAAQLVQGLRSRVREQREWAWAWGICVCLREKRELVQAPGGSRVRCAHKGRAGRGREGGSKEGGGEGTGLEGGGSERAWRGERGQGGGRAEDGGSLASLCCGVPAFVRIS